MFIVDVKQQCNNNNNLPRKLYKLYNMYINNQLLQLYTARTVFSILVAVRLYTVMPEVCRWLTNEKQRKTDIRLTDQ